MIFTNDPEVLVCLRADRARAAFIEQMHSLARRLGAGELTPDEARAEVREISASYSRTREAIYAGWEAPQATTLEVANPA